MSISSDFLFDLSLINLGFLLTMMPDLLLASYSRFSLSIEVAKHEFFL